MAKFNRAKFQNVFGDGSIKMAHCKKRKKIPLEKFVHWDAPQLINLINMNRNKYPSFVKA
jgi:hypothetical protein